MNLQLEDFEGPFDLLLHLVRISKVDIYKVNIRAIIDQYINFINSIDKYDIDKSSEYLVLASELIHLKSRMLIKKDDEVVENEEEFAFKNEEDLRNKLILYEQYQNITAAFKSLEENRLDYYTKIPENLANYLENEKKFNTQISIDELLNAFLELQRRIDFKKPEITKIAKKEYSVKDKIKEIRDILRNKKRIEFIELFDVLTKENIVVTFLSLLDMTKNKEITLKQDKIFSTIVIESVG